MFKLNELKISIKDALEKWPLGDTLDEGLVLLCEVVVAFYFIRFFIINIYNGGEPFFWKDLRRPFFYMICIAGWSYIFDFINIALNGIVDYAYGNSNELKNLNKDVVSSLNTFSKGLEDKKLIQESLQNTKKLGIFERIWRSVNEFDDKLIMEISSWGYYLAGLLDQALFYVFYMVAEVWKRILAMSGPIAFTVSLFSGGWTVLINWAKNLLSVSLWLPFAALIMSLIDSIMLAVIKSTSKPLLTKLGVASDEVLNAFFLEEALSALLQMLVLVVVFSIIKIIFLGKVPAMIASVVSGGNASGGGFAAAFIPFGLAVSAAKVGGQAAGAVATGGASAGASVAAGAVSKGFKK